MTKDIDSIKTNLKENPIWRICKRQELVSCRHFLPLCNHQDSKSIQVFWLLSPPKIHSLIDPIYLLDYETRSSCWSSITNSMNECWMIRLHLKWSLLQLLKMNCLNFNFKSKQRQNLLSTFFGFYAIAKGE